MQSGHALFGNENHTFSLDPHNLKALEEPILLIIKKLGRLANRYFNQGLEATVKIDRSFVSLADQQIEKQARKLLAKVTPEWGFYGEEFGGVKTLGQLSRREPLDILEDTYWILDPIDGTTNFLSSSPLWSTLLALIHKGEPVLGVCALPGLNEVFVASKNNGSRFGRLFGAPHALRPCFVKSVESLKASRLSATNAKVFDLRGLFPLFPELAQACSEWRTHSDAYGYTRVLRGGIQLMCDPLVMPYDVAALQILFDETPGAHFGTWHGIRGPLRWLGGSALGCAGPHLEQEFLDTVGQVAQGTVSVGGQGYRTSPGADADIPFEKDVWANSVGHYIHDLPAFVGQHTLKGILCTRERALAEFLKRNKGTWGVLEATLSLHPHNPGGFQFSYTLQSPLLRLVTGSDSWNARSNDELFSKLLSCLERRVCSDTMEQTVPVPDVGVTASRLMAHFRVGPQKRGEGLQKEDLTFEPQPEDGWFHFGLSCCSWSFIRM